MRKHTAIVAMLCAWLAVTSAVASAGSCGDDSSVLQRLEVQSILEDVALVHSLDPDLLAAMAQVESGECFDAISPKGAVGLMQLMPATASTYGVDNRFDPVQNALGAARYIDHLKRHRAEGKLTLPEILAAYNAGEGAVSRAGGVPHYRETEDYVRRVLWTYLIGHVPKGLRAHENAMTAQQSSKVKARLVTNTGAKPAHRYAAGSDREILEQLAEVRRARQQSEAGVGLGDR